MLLLAPTQLDGDIKEKAQIFTKHLGMKLSNLLQQEGWTRGPSEAPSHLNYFVFLLHRHMNLTL